MLYLYLTSYSTVTDVYDAQRVALVMLNRYRDSLSHTPVRLCFLNKYIHGNSRGTSEYDFVVSKLERKDRDYRMDVAEKRAYVDLMFNELNLFLRLMSPSVRRFARLREIHANRILKMCHPMFRVSQIKLFVKPAKFSTQAAMVPCEHNYCGLLEYQCAKRRKMLE